MCDVDTRALTRHLRERGAMRVGVSSVETDPAALLARVLDAAGDDRRPPGRRGVAPTEAYVVAAHGETRFRVVAVDLGIKSMTPYRMAERGIEVHVLPATATFAEIVALTAGRGLLLQRPRRSRRPRTARSSCCSAVLAAGIPFFGICFGNQLFGRALGFGTYKLTYGHRGINQPVMDLTTRKVEVTAHNHGFAVDAPLGEQTRPRTGIARVSHVGLNDDVVEGLELRDDDGELISASRCSTTPRPPPARTTPATCSTASST